MAQLQLEKVQGDGTPPLAAEFGSGMTWVIIALLVTGIIAVAFKTSKTKCDGAAIKPAELLVANNGLPGMSVPVASCYVGSFTQEDFHVQNGSSFSGLLVLNVVLGAKAAYQLVF